MKLAVQSKPATCFFEQHPDMALARRAMAEDLGTLLLMVAVTGSGLNAQRLFSDQLGLGLLASAGVIAGALVSLIIAFGSVSGGHLNPLITGLQWLAGQRRLDCTLAYIAAQAGGAVLGAMLASRGFGTDSQAPDLVRPGGEAVDDQSLVRRMSISRSMKDHSLVARS